MAHKRSVCLGVVFSLGVAAGLFGQETRSRAVEPAAVVVNPDPRAPGAQAIVPRFIKLSGRLEDMAGKPVVGVSDVTFALYTEEAGGTPLWYETQTIQADPLGRYTVLLGAMHANGVPVELFTSGEARWLGVQVGNLPETAQGGRVLLVSVPYALKALDSETLGGKPASAYMLAPSESGEEPGPAANPATPGAPSTNLVGTKGKTGPKPLLTQGATTFAASTIDQVVLVQQTGTGYGLYATSPSNFALFGQVTGTSGTTYAVTGITAATAGAGVLGESNATSGGTQGVLGISNSPTGVGVYGKNLATTGFAVGTYGLTSSTGGAGLYGLASATSGATFGILGFSNSTSGFGINAQATATTGATTGLIAKASSPSGIAAIFDNTAGGKIASLRNNGVEKFSVDGGGNLTTNGTVTGNGSGLTNVNAAMLGGVASTGYATLGANAFTGNQTVTGNLTLNGRLNGWLIVPTKTTSCTINGTLYPSCTSSNGTGGYAGTSIGGVVLPANRVSSVRVGRNGVNPSLVGETLTFSCPANANCIADSVLGGTIAGGGGTVTDAGAVTTSYAHTVTNNFGTVGGGAVNTAGDTTGPTSSSCCQYVGGGSHNVASGDEATVAGGRFNTASSFFATVAGGDGNTASGGLATVAGGFGNTASGYASFAAGCSALAVNRGAFVWNGYGDPLNPGCPVTFAEVVSTAVGQFVANAPGGFWLGNSATGATANQPAGDFLYTTTGAVLTTSGVWTNNSDRNLKTAFEPLDESSLLGRIKRLPITSWRYKVDPSSIRHIGPMAQDFYSFFRVGNDDTHISTVDESGVALAGVQALYRMSLQRDRLIRSQLAELRQAREQNRAQEAEIQRLKAEVRDLRQHEVSLASLESRLDRLESHERTVRVTEARPATKPKKVSHIEVAKLSR